MRYQIKRSKWILVYILSVHVSGMVALFAADIPMALSLVLLGGLLSSLGYATQRFHWLSKTDKKMLFQLSSPREFVLFEAGEKQIYSVRRIKFLGPYLLIVMESKWWTTESCLLAVDMFTEREWRQLNQTLRDPAWWP
jgi:hypothetical protein